MKIKSFFLIAMAVLINLNLVIAAILTDPQITQVLATLNDQEIQLAKLAHSKTKNQEVKTFALLMMSSHRQNNEDADELVGKLNIQNQSGQVSQLLKDETDGSFDQLQKLSGSEFDLAYINQQLRMHKNVLLQIENVLMPSASSPELRALLVQTKAKVNGHMRQADQVKSSLI